MTTLKTGTLLAGALALGGLSASLYAEPQEGVILYFAGADALLDDTKDTGLLHALQDLQRHGLSLPPKAMDHEEEIVLNAAVSAALGRCEVRLMTNVDAAVADPSGPLVGVSLRAWGDAIVGPREILDPFEALIKRNVRRSLKADPDHPGLSIIDDRPIGYVGMQEIDDAACAVLGVNMVPGTDVTDWSGAGLPAGTEVLGGIKADAAAFQDILTYVSMEEPQARLLLRRFGLLGDDPLAIEFACGRSGGAMQCAGRVSNYVTHFGQFLPEGGIRRSDLATVPKNATWAQVTRYDLKGLCTMLLKLVEDMAPPVQGQNPIEMARGQFKAMLGIDPVSEFIDYLGTAVIGYRSNATGGGGLMSTVVLAELSDADGMKQSLDTLVSRINMSIAPMARGYFDLRTWQHDACGDVISVTFPGVPVPCEISMAVKDDWLVATLTTQGLVAACEQLDAYGGLSSNQSFMSAGGSKAVGAVQVTWSDFPRQLADGYGYSSALMAAVDNYTRHGGADANRELIMPTYAALAKGAKPSLLIASVEGEDVVIKGTGDSSVVVELTGVLANITSTWGVAAPAFMVGTLLPALNRARDSARVARDKAQMRNLYMSCWTYAQDHDGQWPETLDQLVEAHYATHDMLTLDGGLAIKYIRPGEQAERYPSLIDVLWAIPSTGGDPIQVRYDGSVQQMSDDH